MVLYNFDMHVAFLGKAIHKTESNLKQIRIKHSSNSLSLTKLARYCVTNCQVYAIWTVILIIVHY